MKTKQETGPTLEQLTSGLIISVGEARKILGNDAKNLPDEAVAVLVLNLFDLAHELLKNKHFDE